MEDLDFSELNSEQLEVVLKEFGLVGLIRKVYKHEADGIVLENVYQWLMLKTTPNKKTLKELIYCNVGSNIKVSAIILLFCVESKHKKGVDFFDFFKENLDYAGPSDKYLSKAKNFEGRENLKKDYKKEIRIKLTEEAERLFNDFKENKDSFIFEVPVLEILQSEDMVFRPVEIAKIKQGGNTYGGNLRLVKEVAKKASGKKGVQVLVLSARRGLG